VSGYGAWEKHFLAFNKAVDAHAKHEEKKYNNGVK
jgi:hypothetical protein